MSQVNGKNMRGTTSEVVDSASTVPHRFVPQPFKITGLDSFGPAAECCLWDSTCEPCLAFIRNLLSLPELDWRLKRTWRSNPGSPDFPTPVIHSSECVLCRLFHGPRHFKSQFTVVSPYTRMFRRDEFYCTSEGPSALLTLFKFVAARDEKECAEMPAILHRGGQGHCWAENSDSE